ncbi:MAG: ROK family transcriptional regulator [Clostridia bacterium]|nr:ROK family transcriptional regulator [Clostridia bacterium]
MQSSADIRRENRKRIYRLLLDGKSYTKQQLAAGTGLSVPTCNTLLNEMQALGVVNGTVYHTGEVGRSSALYRIDEMHEAYLAISFRVEMGLRVMESVVFSALGNVLRREKVSFSQLDASRISCQVKKVLDASIVHVLLAIPGIADHGMIRYSDIHELERIPLKDALEAEFCIPVTMETDMHCMAYGYSRREGHTDDVITLAYFPSNLFPGTATIHKGTIIRGAYGIAGMAGFLPYGVSREEQLQLLVPATCIPYVAKSLCAIMVLLNPGTIVLSGDLINPGMLVEVRRICAEDIPAEYMADFVIADSFQDSLYAGLFEMAVDSKII